jgi:hypothetical protein
MANWKNPKGIPDVAPESPIYFDPISNGEYFPLVKPKNMQAKALVHRMAGHYAPKLGISRRRFLE